MAEEDHRYYMAEIEVALDRGRSTIRSWERWPSWPESLHFHRDGNGWRYWTQAQLDEARRWLADRNPGRSRAR